MTSDATASREGGRSQDGRIGLTDQAGALRGEPAESSANTNHQPRRDRCGAGGPLLLCACGRLKQESDLRGWCGDEAEADAARPRSAPSGRIDENEESEWSERRRALPRGIC